MIKRLKCKKGITLIEIVVAMLIFTIVATIASLILSSILRMFFRANELAECGAIFDNISNQMIYDMSKATKSIKISDSDTEISFPIITNTVDESGDEGEAEEEGEPDDTVGLVVYTINNGYLEKDGAPVFHVDFYRRKKVDFICAETPDANETAYMLTIIVLSNEDIELARRDYAVKPLVLNDYLP